MTTPLQKYRIAYLQGKQAAENGWERQSPYSRVVAEGYWYAGYDGVDYNTYVLARKTQTPLNTET